MLTASQGGKKRGSERCDIAVLPVVCETDRQTETLTETETETETENSEREREGGRESV